LTCGRPTGSMAALNGTLLVALVVALPAAAWLGARRRPGAVVGAAEV